jgi:hypothetical protein
MRVERASISFTASRHLVYASFTPLLKHSVRPPCIAEERSLEESLCCFIRDSSLCSTWTLPGSSFRRTNSNGMDGCSMDKRTSMFPCWQVQAGNESLSCSDNHRQYNCRKDHTEETNSQVWHRYFLSIAYMSVYFAHMVCLCVVDCLRLILGE